jgi:Family of unknown function (DUF6788)
MSESLLSLEKDRSEVVHQIAQLGDFRPGSILGVMGRCSKPNCHCARPGDPGHGPNFRLTAKVEGKTVAETLSSPAALRKAQQEVAEFRRFQKLSQELIALNGRICRLRPVAQQRGGWTEQEKNGCCDPSRGGAGSKSTPPAGLCPTTQGRSH